ncbi:hypothetical protein A2U01_0039981 [Trifolium medium]|uniref:Uncharacterized protein n=1 Tax=Trifolium medium TaxID=97028 RepID=A0A392Q5J9_9FABA|nr:hypothetical protein [Trifolium medium]
MGRYSRRTRMQLTPSNHNDTGSRPIHNSSEDGTPRQRSKAVTTKDNVTGISESNQKATKATARG